MGYESSWIRGGKITEIAWVDKDVIAWCSGVHVVFINLVTRNVTVHCSESVDGACCISGNPTMRLLCFAEKCSSPRLLIYSYSTMSLITECLGGSENGYFATAFASSNLIISLGTYPNYLMIIWNWKTGEKLLSIPSPIHDLKGQSIKLCNARPTLIAQLGKDTEQLFIWTIVTSTTIVMSYQKVLLPDDMEPVNVDWSTDHGNIQLAIVDKHGHVYISNKDGSEVHRVVFSQRCGLCLEYESPAVCWFLGGIMLKTTFCQIRFYKKKQGSNWRRERYVKSKFKPYLLTRHPSESSKLFYFTTEGFLIEMNLTDGEEALNINDQFYYGGIYNFVDFIYPWGHDLVVIDNFFVLYIIDVITASVIGKLKMELEGEIIQVISHPDYPIVAMITTNGELALVTVHVPEKPSLAFKYRLQNDELDLLKFSQCGKHVLVGEKKTGICYCIISTQEDKFSIIYQVTTDHKIIDAVLYDENGVFEVLILGLSSRQALVGHYIFIYELLSSQEMFMVPTNVIKLPYLYERLHYAPENPKILIATPYLSRQIHFLHIKHGHEITLIKAVSTQHKLRHIKIYCNRQTITTSGFDGMVTIFENEQLKKAATILLSHHRKDLGVSVAIRSPSGHQVIALGRNGSLVCLKLKQNDKELHSVDKSERRKIVSSDYSNLDSTIYAMLSRPCQIIPPVMEDSKKTWIEWKREQIYLQETEQFKVKKIAVQERFNELKRKLVNLLNDNEICPDPEKLPVTAFDLAMLTRKQKFKVAREEREDLRLHLEFKCTSMDKVAEWIKKTFWDSQIIASKAIFAIFDDKHVMNYPTISEDPQETETINWIRSSTEINTETKGCSNTKLYSVIKDQYRPSGQDEISVIESLSVDDDDEFDDEDKLKQDQLAGQGMTTCRFITPTCQYSQYENYTFDEFFVISKDLNNDVQQLKNYFNILFEEMYKIKEQEMTTLNELIDKIHHIKSELSSMFDQSVTTIVDKPNWHCQERPEMIIKVSDSEVKLKPFISASQQELLDKQAAEAEIMRLLLIADDFREKALLCMMDGVLEVCWEDIIKKNIPVPQCMLIKKPEEYIAEDILSVAKYEEDVKALKVEREKYRRILEADFIKTNKILKENVKKFNDSLHNIVLTRIKIESAIQQINFICARKYLQASYQLNNIKEGVIIKNKIVDEENRIEEFLEQNRVLQGLLTNARTRREELDTEQKIMLKQFKKDFSSLPQTTHDLMKKQYKIRPKVSLKNTTADDLVELGNCIISHNSSDYIDNYCREYLAGVNNIDIQPAALAELVTPYHWNHLVEVRRRKIELDLKRKANWTEINEIERGITQNKKKIAIFKYNNSNLEDQLIEIQEKQLNFQSDIEIQLILKLGQVEMDVHGQRGEMENCVFLPRSKISKINEEIKKYGGENVKALKRVINFQRGIIFKEWEHQYLKMKMDDLKNEFHEITTFFVTKDTHVFLRRLSLGLKEDKTLYQLEKEIDAMKRTWHKLLMDSVLRLESIEAKIEAKSRSNIALDKTITRTNVNRWKLELKRDLGNEDRQENFRARHLALARHRSKLLREIQQEHTELVDLKSEYENLRKKKFPNLSFIQVLGEDDIRNKV